VTDRTVPEANRLIAYHSPISRALTDERTSLESALIPVTAYIVVACVEAYLRYPEMIRRIDAVMPAEEIGRRARRPGVQVNAVYLWSIANFFLLGRKVLQAIDPNRDDPVEAFTVLDFWERAATAFRGDDGTRQAWDAGGIIRVYDGDVIATLSAGLVPVTDDADRARIKRWNATLVNHLFLLYFDTRVGTGDTGPYRLPNGRTLLVRDYYRIGQSDFAWSDVAAGVPYANLTAALVLDDVDVEISDFGSSRTTPEDYLDRLVAFSLFTTDTPDRSLRPVPLDELDGILSAVRTAQAAHYRAIAAMSRDEKIRCGAYVYFSFLKPFADVAGIGDELDWTVPRDMPELWYQLFSAMEGENQATDDDGDYYSLFPNQPDEDR
jgi:hypothetical protein